MKENNLNVLDLFCGCGGLSLGFEKEGYKIVLGIDNDVDSLKTFENNHKGSKVLNLDLSKDKNIKEITKKLKENIDVIIAGPPCQGFSLTGPREWGDERNKLYLSVFKIVKLLKPKAFLIENVPGIATLYDGKAKREIIKKFSNIGYNVEMKKLLAANYGVPQMRRRVFFMGIINEEGKPSFPSPTHDEKNFVTCSDAISDLPRRRENKGRNISKYTKEAETKYQEIMRKNSDKLYNHVGTNHSDYVREVISQVPEGGNHKDLPPGVGESRNFNEAWTRYHGDKPSKTIDTGHRNHFHYTYNRVPTVREKARLQSFPDDFIFTGTKTSQNRQVGNAVPPLLGSHLAKEIKKILNNE